MAHIVAQKVVPPKGGPKWPKRVFLRGHIKWPLRALFCAMFGVKIVPSRLLFLYMPPGDCTARSPPLIQQTSVKREYLPYIYYSRIVCVAYSGLMGL